MIYITYQHTFFLLLQGPTARSGEVMNDEAVFVKKFPRYEDTYCLGIEEKARSLKLFDDFARNGTSERGLGTRNLIKV